MDKIKRNVQKRNEKRGKVNEFLKRDFFRAFGETSKMEDVYVSSFHSKGLWLSDRDREDERPGHGRRKRKS